MTAPDAWRPFRSRVGAHVLVLRGTQILDVGAGSPVHDADPTAKGAAKAVKVKIASPYQPVPPDPIPGHPFAPVEFEQMAITPYVVEVMKGRYRVAYSIQARGMTSPAGA